MIINTQIKGGGTAPRYYIEKAVDANGRLENTSYKIDLAGVTDIKNNALESAYMNNKSITGTALKNFGIKKLGYNYSLQNAFNGCTNITSTGLDSLEDAEGVACLSGAFSGCTSLTSTGLNNLRIIWLNPISSMFYGCVSLSNIGMDNLRYIGSSTMTSSCMQSVFNGCTGLITADFKKLVFISGYFSSNSSGATFSGCTGLTNVYFRALTPKSFYYYTDGIKALRYMFNSTTGSINGCTVHFPANFDPSDPNHAFDASTLMGYPTFGGNASYISVAFDMPNNPAIELVPSAGQSSQWYAREPEKDGTNSLAWYCGYAWNGNDIKYTSGTTLPSVNDNVYDDEACTVLSTTVISIV